MTRLSFTPPPRKKSHFRQYKKWLEENLYYHFCAYCVISHGHLEVEHFEPVRLSPGKIHDPNNLLLACSDCNGRAGKSDYHSKHSDRTREKNKSFAVIDIRKDNFVSLFVIDQKTGKISGKIGRNFDKAVNNIVLMNLDRPYLEKMRREYCDTLATANDLLRIKKKDSRIHACLNRIFDGLSKYELFFQVFGIKFTNSVKRRLNEDRKRAASLPPLKRTKSSKSGKRKNIKKKK